ncbi:MAG: hypothetical protein ACRDK7_10265 [Solirubrobacteraceae bacterium]
MSDGIYLLREDDELVEMLERPYDSEAVLQQLLAKHPSLLAGDQLEGAAPRRWLLVAREASLPANADGGGRWSVDHLFLDQDAVPTLVEVKRSSDTRIRREVVGQMLDYAANAVVYWPVERLRATFEASCEVNGLDPEDTVLAIVEDGETADGFWEHVDTNLRAGKVRLVFVADELPPELQRVIEFLNVQMSPAEVIGIEVRQYVGQGLKTLVPRVLGQTAKAQQRKGRAASSLRREWSWEAYRDEQGIPEEKLETAKTCFLRIQEALLQRGLDWQPVFRQGYFGFQRPGGYHVIVVDLRPRVPWVSVKLPDPPDQLGLTNPYPNLDHAWDPDHRQWGWSVPDAASVPDLGLAIDFSHPHQPDSGPMRPPSKGDAPGS